MIETPKAFNYIGAFLTMRCPYKCSYCINRFENKTATTYGEIKGKDWIEFFQNLETHGVPITLQGGEPGSHSDFIRIVQETSKIHNVDILTNLTFDLDKFIKAIDPSDLNREAPYAPIRVSYHPEQFSLPRIIKKVQKLEAAGFRTGIYGVMHPEQIVEIKQAQLECTDLGIDFRTKPFLGWYKGELHGEYAYPDACSLETQQECECAPSELLIAPDGSIHPCHHHLYNRIATAKSIFNQDLILDNRYYPCSYYGHCNPCDVKVKNNRFQQFGHVSTRIRLPKAS